MSVKSWKWWFCGTVLALLASNALWLYNAIDVGISRNYEEASFLECERQAKQLELIANHFISGKPLSEVQPFLLSTTDPESSFEKPSEHLLIVGDLALRLGPTNMVEALVRDPYNQPQQLRGSRALTAQTSR